MSVFYDQRYLICPLGDAECTVYYFFHGKQLIYDRRDVLRIEDAVKRVLETLRRNQ